MAALPLDAVPLERISDRAHAARPGVSVLRVLTGLLFWFGWLTARAAGLLWLGVAWAAIAVSEGWREGMKANGRRPRAS